MIRATQVTIVTLAAILCASCSADPLWEREGGFLNPWGGDFLGITSAKQRIRYRQFIEDWGINKPDPYNPSNKL